MAQGRFIAFEADKYSLRNLLGKSPSFDSCIATLAITRVQYPKEFEKWFEDVKIYPAFIFFKDSYYRITGMHSLSVQSPALFAFMASIINLIFISNHILT